LFDIWNASKVWNPWILRDTVLTSHDDLNNIYSESSSFIRLFKNLG